MKVTMDQVKAMFPDAQTKYGLNFDYGPVDEFVGKAVVSVSDGDYQGTTRILYQNKEDPSLYAVREYDWGSCSGCDFMQGCNTWDELLEYVQHAVDGVEWGTASETLKVLDKMEADTREWRQEEVKEFIAESRKFLNGAKP